MMEKYEHIVKIEQLPPGFKFDPTDEELVLHFLYSKLESSSNSQNNTHLIPQLEEFYHHYHPSQLQGVAFESCNQWYFYTRKTDNRISENGYWKELMDIEQPILGSKSNKLAGFKKCLVFYKGKYPSSGVKTRWFMQEYHACISSIVGDTRRSKHPDFNKWVLCRVQHIIDESHWMMNTFYEDNYNKEVELSSSDEAVFVAMEEDNDDQDEVISSPYYNVIKN
ncbi:hypothetical protein BVRB_6g132760 isoform B [Beta vulgaris subsp. vulgaris]|nr:hypothetical protein BVRB_6g132760 isoform B [Beta vulgaris subsp. vulgaris]